MTTIVKHKRTGNKYIFLGINGESNKATPSRFLSELFTQEKSEVSCTATVCDFQGNIFLAYIDDLVITEIDGKKPSDILPEPSFTSVSNDAYQRQAKDFEDDLEEEDLAENQNVSTNSQAASVSSQSSSNRSSNQSDFDDDDEDWI